MAVKPPHILRASSNVRKMRSNLEGTVDRKALSAIDRAILDNVKSLLSLGKEHYDFACAQGPGTWRQCVSRLYYGAYNASRAVRLYRDGRYSTDAADHKEVGKLPDDFPDRERYSNELDTLREDRNLCDYDHTAVGGDLARDVAAWRELVGEFIERVGEYIKEGVD